MRIHYLSNFWLDINSLNLDVIKPDPEGILFVAGDLIPVEYIKNGQHQNFSKFLDLISGFDKCIFVLGELEHYNGFYEATYASFYNELKLKSPHKFFLLENEHMKLNENTYIFGATFWTKNPNRNIYDAIKTRNGGFLEELVTGLHKQTANYLNVFCKEMSSKNIIVLTHFPPDIDIISENSNITHWVYGHGYNPIEYIYNQCSVLSNPMVEKTDSWIHSFEIES